MQKFRNPYQLTLTIYEAAAIKSFSNIDPYFKVLASGFVALRFNPSHEVLDALDKYHSGSVVNAYEFVSFIREIKTRVMQLRKAGNKG